MPPILPMWRLGSILQPPSAHFSLARGLQPYRDGRNLMG